VAAAAAASSGGETTTEFSEDSKENNNGANPKSPAAVPVLKKEQQIAVDTTNNKTAAIAKPLVEKTFIKPAPLTDFEKLFMAKKKKGGDQSPQPTQKLHEIMGNFLSIAEEDREHDAFD
jgi:hypothetical protein